MSICGVDFNDSGWGWDTCTLNPGHAGDHYDDTSKSYGRNYNDPAKKAETPKHKRPLWMRR